MKRLLLPLILLVASQSLSAQDAFSTLEERMTAREFAAAGLDKLSGAELAALNEWLRSHSVATLQNAHQDYDDARGKEVQTAQEKDGSTIVSRIVGQFDGWAGEGTVIRLENGMVWRTVGSDRFSMPSTENAVAVIEKGLFKSWRLKIEGYDTTVKVKRIE